MKLLEKEMNKMNNNSIINLNSIKMVHKIIKIKLIKQFYGEIKINKN